MKLISEYITVDGHEENYYYTSRNFMYNKLKRQVVFALALFRDNCKATFIFSHSVREGNLINFKLSLHTQ